MQTVNLKYYCETIMFCTVDQRSYYRYHVTPYVPVAELGYLKGTEPMKYCCNYILNFISINNLMLYQTAKESEVIEPVGEMERVFYSSSGNHR